MDKSKLIESLRDIVQDLYEGGYADDGTVVDVELGRILALTDSYYLGLVPGKKEALKIFYKYGEERASEAKGFNAAIDELRNRIGGSDGRL